MGKFMRLPIAFVERAVAGKGWGSLGSAAGPVVDLVE